jgi:methanogenic corrinoid protein MtbC1
MNTGVPDIATPGVELEKALLSMDRLAARRVLHEATARSGVRALETLLIPTLERIGRGWEEGDIALSQVYMGGRICEELVEELLPPDARSDGPEPRLAITMLHDYHALGKRVVTSVLRANGYAVLDYGRTEVDDVEARIRNDGVRILLVSTLMLASALRVKELTTRLAASASEVKVVVGGAPFRFDEKLWQDVGADGFGRTASDALEQVRRWPELGP